MGTSRVFAAILATYDRLSAASWPSDMTGGDAPVVVLGSAPTEPPKTLVRVSAVPTEDVTQEWATNISREERFAVLIEAACWYAHEDEATALRHMWQVCDVIQRAFVPDAGPDPLLSNDITLANQPRTYLPQITPQIDAVDPSGYGWRALVRVPMTFRI